MKGKKIIYKKIHKKDEKDDLDFIRSYSFKDFARNQIIDKKQKKKKIKKKLIFFP